MLSTTPMKIKRNRLYPTYQIMLDIYPVSGITLEECFSKVILYIMEWIGKKAEGGAGIKELSSYPAVEEFRDFNIEKATPIDCDTPIVLKTFYFDGTFALNLTERNLDFDGEFITNISVTLNEESVLLATRTECRQPEGGAEAKSMRPWYITKMISDTDLILTESGISKDYEINGKAFIVSGKSNEELNKIYKGLIDNPARRLPIMFFPMPSEEFPMEELDDQVRHIMAYYHAVVIDKSYNKFFHNIMVAPEYIGYLSDLQVVLCENTNEEAKNSCFCIPCDENLTESLREIRNKEPLSRNIDFGNVRFLSELHIAFFENEIRKAREEGNDIAMLESLSKQNADLQRELNLKATDLKEKDNEISGLKKDLDQKNESLNKVIREHERSEKDAWDKLDKANKSIEQIDNKLKETCDRLSVYEDMAGVNDELTDLVLSSFSLLKGNDKENYIEWVDHCYRDTVTLHDKAKEAIRKDNVPRNWNDICQATHYLSCFVRVMSKGSINIQDAGIAAKDYCRKLKGFQVTGSMSETTKNMYGDKYLIDISDSDDPMKTKQVYLDQHITIGVDSEKLVRIYFYYDSVSKKAIIGYMPGHLPTSSR